MGHIGRISQIRRIRPILLSLLLAAFALSATAAEWPRFRGPNGTGQGGAVELPDHWTDADFHWRTDLPGVGNSSPVISGKHVVVTSAEPHKEKLYVSAYDVQTGQPLWRTELDSPRQAMHLRNSNATSTPAIDEKQVYVTGIGPKGYFATALKLEDGSQAWRVELGPFAAQHGFGASSILHENCLIVPNDQDGASFVVALDAASGAEKWRTPRRSGRAAYSAPCIFAPAGRTAQVVLTSPDNGMSGLDASSGKLLWSVDVFPERTVGSPLVAGDLILANCGKGNGGQSMVAVRPPAKDSEPATVAYTLTQSVPYVTTPVVRGDLLFLIHDMGTVSCHELATGKRLWNKRLTGNFSGSPILLDDRLLAVTNDGDAVLLSAGRTFKELARNPLGQSSRATPAVAGGHVYVRTESKLFCLGGK